MMWPIRPGVKVEAGGPPKSDRTVVPDPRSWGTRGRTIATMRVEIVKVRGCGSHGEVVCDGAESVHA